MSQDNQPSEPAANQPAPAPAPAASAPQTPSTDDRLKKIEAFIEKYGPRLAALLGE